MTEANSISMPVAGGLEDASAVLVDHRIDQFALVSLENSEGFFLVRAHQPRIADDIGAQDRRQPPLYPFLRHRPAPREEKARIAAPLVAVDLPFCPNSP